MAKKIRRFFSIRNWVQLASTVALNSSLSGGIAAKWFCLPVMNCHACALAWTACPIGVLIHYSGYRIFPFFVAGLLLLFGALVGRLFCGWVCPIGLVQDLLYRIKSRKLELPRWAGWIKYAVLALMVFILPFLFGEDSKGAFCYYCPTSALEVTVPQVIKDRFAPAPPSEAPGEAAAGENAPVAPGDAAALPASSAPALATVVSATEATTALLTGVGPMKMLKLAIMVAVFLASVFYTRFFCRVLCPIGALVAPFNYFSFWRVKPIPCRGCKACDKACPTDVHPSVRFDAGVAPSRTADCVVCHDCQTACPFLQKAAAAAK